MKQPHSSFRSPLPILGFSLIEVLVAVTILTVSGLGLILTFRGGGARQENFSSEHYSAMFLTQKILEEVNSRLQENPHFFTALANNEFAAKSSVLDGRSPFFKLLENTSGLDNLQETEDKPLTPDSGPIYQQLKNFTASLECTSGQDPKSGVAPSNLLEMKVTINWKDRQGREQDYVVNQLVQGFNPKTYQALPSAYLAGYSPDDIGRVLWGTFSPSDMPSPPTLQSFLTKNGGDSAIVEAFGSFLHAYGLCKRLNDKGNAHIASLTAERDAARASADPKMKAKAADLQLKIAEYFVEKGSQQAALLAGMLPAIKALEGKQFTLSQFGSLIGPQIDGLAEIVWKASYLTDRISFDFNAAYSLLATLMSPPMRNDLAERKAIPCFRQMVDLAKLQLLMENDEKRGAQRVSELKALLDYLNGAFRGRQPYFVEYLLAEYQICTSPETIFQYFGGSAGLSGLLIKIRDSGGDLGNIYDVIPPSGNSSGGTGTGLVISGLPTDDDTTSTDAGTGTGTGTGRHGKGNQHRWGQASSTVATTTP